MMNFSEYETERARTQPQDLSWNDQVCLMSMGLAGECGELVDALKKDVFHGVGVPQDHVEGELGEILWYLTGMASLFGLSLQGIAEANTEKLRKRYPDGFVKGGGIR